MHKLCIIEKNLYNYFKRPVIWGLANCGTKSTDNQKYAANMMGRMYQEYSSGEYPWSVFIDNEVALVYSDTGISTISGLENYAPMLHFWIHEYPTLLDQL